MAERGRKGQQRLSEKNKLESPDSKPSSQDLFTFEEQRAIVRRFIDAYLSGAVTVIQLTPEMIKDQRDITNALAKQFPNLQDLANLSDAEIAVRIRNEFLTVLRIAAGIVEATKEQRRVAIIQMFYYILSLRTANRLRGNFLDVPRFESKLKDLEDMVNRHDELLKELEILMRNLGQGSSK
jgi:hypothetical protein